MVFFSTGGGFSRRTRTADLGAARFGQRGIARGGAHCEFRPRPRPVPGPARSRSRKKRISFASDLSGSAVPSRIRETRSARQLFSKNNRPVNPIQYLQIRSFHEDVRPIFGSSVIPHIYSNTLAGAIVAATKLPVHTAEANLVKVYCTRYCCSTGTSTSKYKYTTNT